MCSRKCDLPVWPSSSFREPTRYQIIVATTGLSCSSFVRRVRPFGRIVFRTLRVMKDSVCDSECVAALDVSVPVDVIGVVIEASRMLDCQASTRLVAAKILEAGKKACQTT